MSIAILSYVAPDGYSFEAKSSQGLVLESDSHCPFESSSHSSDNHSEGTCAHTATLGIAELGFNAPIRSSLKMNLVGTLTTDFYSRRHTFLD